MHNNIAAVEAMQYYVNAYLHYCMCAAGRCFTPNPIFDTFKSWTFEIAWRKASYVT